MDPQIKSKKSLMADCLSDQGTNKKVKFFADSSENRIKRKRSSSSEGIRQPVPDNAHWKDKTYYRLPENVRNAVDIAEMKTKHSQFYYKL